MGEYDKKALDSAFRKAAGPDIKKGGCWVGFDGDTPICMNVDYSSPYSDSTQLMSPLKDNDLMATAVYLGGVIKTIVERDKLKAG